VGLTSHNWGYAMSSNDTNQTSNKQARDGFFVISMEAWEGLFECAMSDGSESEAVRAMAAYLTLCCGSGGDHKTTSWSAGAIRKHAGISQRPAERAIKLLESLGHIDTVKKAEKNKLPIYKIDFADNNPKEQSTDNIFVPNGVVTGVNGEESPLKRLVKYQDPYVLYLFVRLYGFQDKYLDVIEPSIVSSVLSDKNTNLDAEKLFNHKGFFQAWSIDGDITLASYFKSKFYDFTKHKNERFLDERTGDDSFFGFLGILENLNLLSRVTYACNGEMASSADEIDFICDIGSKTQSDILEAIHEDSKVEGSDFGFIDFLDGYSNYVILPPTYRKVHFQQFYQLRYRTKLGESRNRYTEEKELHKTMSNHLKKIGLIS
jgi:hypothetical protein|tara:strand:- start:188 stop:1312 length:1125 start_codon:yes stop_codon:yes gene_type:complete